MNHNSPRAADLEFSYQLYKNVNGRSAASWNRTDAGFGIFGKIKLWSTY